MNTGDSVKTDQELMDEFLDTNRYDIAPKDWQEVTDSIEEDDD